MEGGAPKGEMRLVRTCASERRGIRRSSGSTLHRPHAAPTSPHRPTPDCPRQLLFTIYGQGAVNRARRRPRTLRICADLMDHPFHSTLNDHGRWGFVLLGGFDTLVH
jgi:hypothetical protein